MDWSWITTTWTAVVMSAITAAGIYLAVIVYTRLVGLRSFSKMSSFDYAMTVAIGSLVATTVLAETPPLLLGVTALGALYGLQLIVALLRERLDFASRAVDNEPVLLMEEGHMLEDAMRAEEITRADLLAKLREANVLRFDQVRAVVLETTGDVSVVHADPGEGALEEALLEGVRRR